MQETRVRSPGQKDPLKKEVTTPSSILAWEMLSMDRVAWWAAVHRVTKETDITKWPNYCNNASTKESYKNSIWEVGIMSMTFISVYHAIGLNSAFYHYELVKTLYFKNTEYHIML